MTIKQILNSKFLNTFLHVYAIWLREFKVYLRERSRIVGSLFTPLLWLFIIGSGIGSSTTLSIDVRLSKIYFSGYNKYVNYFHIGFLWRIYYMGSKI